MKTFIICFVIATWSTVFVTSITPVLQCLNTSADTLPISVTINDCTALPCTVSKSSTNHVNVKFKTVSAVSNLLGVGGVVVNNTNNLVSLNAISDVCSRLSEGSCPVTAGETLTLTFNQDTPSTLPLGTGLSALVSISDTTSKIQSCFIVPLNIED